MDGESTRAARLLEAQARAAELFAEIESRGLVARGEGERAVSDRIRDLANELFGTTRHWHKRIVRSGPNTLVPYKGVRRLLRGAARPRLSRRHPCRAEGPDGVGGFHAVDFCARDVGVPGEAVATEGGRLDLAAALGRDRLTVHS